MATTKARTAQISLGAKGQTRAVRVSRPGKLTPERYDLTDKKLATAGCDRKQQRYGGELHAI
jgi:hypothetical protein